MALSSVNMRGLLASLLLSTVGCASRVVHSDDIAFLRIGDKPLSDALYIMRSDGSDYDRVFLDRTLSTLSGLSLSGNRLLINCKEYKNKTYRSFLGLWQNIGGKWEYKELPHPSGWFGSPLLFSSGTRLLSQTIGTDRKSIALDLYDVGSGTVVHSFELTKKIGDSSSNLLWYKLLDVSGDAKEVLLIRYSREDLKANTDLQILNLSSGRLDSVTGAPSGTATALFSPVTKDILILGTKGLQLMPHKGSQPILLLDRAEMRGLSFRGNRGAWCARTNSVFLPLYDGKNKTSDIWCFDIDTRGLRRVAATDKGHYDYLGCAV